MIGHERIRSRWSLLFKTLEKTNVMYSAEKHISGCQEPAAGGRVPEEGTRRLLGVKCRFYLLSVGVVTQVYIFVKIPPVAHLKWVQSN